MKQEINKNLNSYKTKQDDSNNSITKWLLKNGWMQEVDIINSQRSNDLIYEQ